MRPLLRLIVWLDRDVWPLWGPLVAVVAAALFLAYLKR